MAIITGLIAKENAIAVLCTLSASVIGGLSVAGEEAIIRELLEFVNVGTPALLAFIAFNMTTIPCFAAVAAAKGELLNKKRFNFTLLFWLVTSYVTASAIYIIGTYPLTALLYLAVAIVLGVLIYLNNKKIRNKKLKGQ